MSLSWVGFYSQKEVVSIIFTKKSLWKGHKKASFTLAF